MPAAPQSAGPAMRRSGGRLAQPHLAIATHNAGETDVDGHLDRIAAYLQAVG